MTFASVCSVFLVSSKELCLVAILRFFFFSATTADSGWVLLKGELISCKFPPELNHDCLQEREYLVGIGCLARIGYLAFMTRNYALIALLVIAWKMRHEQVFLHMFRREIPAFVEHEGAQESGGNHQRMSCLKLHVQGNLGSMYLLPLLYGSYTSSAHLQKRSEAALPALCLEQQKHPDPGKGTNAPFHTLCCPIHPMLHPGICGNNFTNATRQLSRPNEA